ncbi:MAG: hypothetical protein IH586_15030, partial [Anaerolineaceae bacterium]|nr:hypothetical protein [Anaerolineaceae bacterium]
MDDKPKMFTTKSCISAITIIILLCSILTIGFLTGSQRNEKLMSGKYDAQISEELDSIAEPVIQKIYLYKSDQSVYPENINDLIPNYLSSKPTDYLDGSLRYSPEPYHGAPFFFSYGGSYSGFAFMHGWEIVYCPVVLCELSDASSRRISDNW